MIGNENLQTVRYMKEDIEPTRDHYFKTIVSFSHLMGMISSNVVDYLRSAFPENHFKTVWNSMEEPFSQRARSFRDAMSKPRPALYLVPKFDPSDESNFVPQSEFDQEIANTPVSDTKIGIWNSTEIAGYKNFRLFAKPRRYKMTFDLKFIFDTEVQRIQTQEHIRQSIRHKTPIQLHQWLENVIPTNYMMAIANMNGYDYRSDEFLTYINQFSIIPITRRLRTGSGTMEFFAMQRSPIDIMLPNVPNNEGPIRKGNIVVNSSFSDFLIIEFCAYSVYFLVTSKDPGGNIEYKDNTNTNNIDGSLDMVGVDKLFLKELPDTNYLENGCIKIKQLTVQPDKNGTEVINLINTGIINNVALVEMINHYKKNKNLIDFIHILVFEGVNSLDGGRVSLDRNTLDLKITNMDMYQTYCIAIYLDRNKTNKEVLKYFIPDDYDKIK